MTDPSRAPSLEAIGMEKRFGVLAALDNVSMRVEAGSVHALLGENGAGKSTLVKCIMGYYRPDSGAVVLDGHEITIRSPRDAHLHGIGMVYQHFTLVPSMTVLENLVLARAPGPGRIDWEAERARLDDFLRTMPFTVRLTTPVAALAAGERQKAEILKQLYLDARFLILDEPTSVLTPQEADEMLSMLRSMARSGRITVLIITHKFREVLAFADAVTVLRRGRLAGGGSVGALGVETMARLMVGEDRIADAAPRALRAPGAELVTVEALEAVDDSGATALRGVSLAVRAGEIVGIAGVSGNGQSALVEVLAGQRRARAGAVRIHGTPYHATRREMLAHRLAVLPEEPLRNAAVATMSVAANMALRRFDQPPIAHGMFLRAGPMRAEAETLIARYRVKTPSADAAIGTLSGGNVQRAVLGRELGREADVLIAANPVFGLDFAAVADIHAQIIAARNRGTAVLLVSEDLDELLELADRILVMADGRVVYETDAATADRMLIGQHMAGHA